MAKWLSGQVILYKLSSPKVNLYLYSHNDDKKLRHYKLDFVL